MDIDFTDTNLLVWTAIIYTVVIIAIWKVVVVKTTAINYVPYQILMTILMLPITFFIVSISANKD